MIAFIADALEDHGLICGSRLITSAMRFAVLATQESNPSERHALEQLALRKLRAAYRREARS